jgi:hypothetical protein
MVHCARRNRTAPAENMDWKMGTLCEEELLRSLQVVGNFGKRKIHEGVFKSFRTGRLERELQMVQLSATRCSCIAILWSQYSEFCRHNPLCCFSTSVYYCCLFRYDSVRKLLDTPSYNSHRSSRLTLYSIPAVLNRKLWPGGLQRVLWNGY